jgi:hypothetical protein
VPDDQPRRTCLRQGHQDQWGVQSRYEGDIDLRGFLGLSEDIPVGYQEILVFFTVDADVSDQEKEEMVKMAQKYSPVFNTITKSAPVSVRLEK